MGYLRHNIEVVEILKNIKLFNHFDLIFKPLAVLNHCEIVSFPTHQYNPDLVDVLDLNSWDIVILAIDLLVKIIILLLVVKLLKILPINYLAVVDQLSH